MVPVMAKKKSGKGGKGGSPKKEGPQKAGASAGGGAKKRPAGPSKAAGSGRGLFHVLGSLPSWYPLPALMLIGLLFRLSTTLWEPVTYPDSLQYMHLAGEIRSGEYFSSDYALDEGFIKSRRLPPLYPALMALFAHTSLDLETVGISISLFMGLATFVALYIACSVVFSRGAAIASCAILAFHTYSLRYSSPVLTEATFTAFYMGAIAAGSYTLLRPSARAFALTGVLSALCYLTRDVGITVAPVTAVFALVKLLFVDRLGWKRTLAMVASLLAAALVVMAPYLVNIRVRTGHWGLTVQMSNTSITKQVQLFGGDRYDRDKVAGWEGGTRLIGGEPAEGVLDLVKLAPGLVKKTVRNMGGYGAEILWKWGPLVTIAVIIAAGGVVTGCFRRRDRTGLLMGLWAITWVAQLWVLYSLITPYMVDDRYMYPLMPAGFMLAGQGVMLAAGYMRTVAAGADESGGGGFIERNFKRLAIVLPLFAVLYLAYLPTMVDPREFKYFAYSIKNKEAVFVPPLIGAGVFFILAMLPVVRLFPQSWYKTPDSAIKAALASGLLGVAAAAVLRATDINVPEVNIIPFFQVLPPFLLNFLPGLVLAGLAGAFAIHGMFSKGRVSGSALQAGFAAFLVAGLFAAQVHSYVVLDSRSDPSDLGLNYAAGHKQAAREIDEKGLVPAGSVICSRKPFMAYYLNGDWYTNRKTNEPVPKTPKELKALIESGEIDFLVVDSFTYKALRPELTRYAFGLEPLPGARPVYSRYFEEYKRIITLWDCRGGEEESPAGSVRQHLANARAYMGRNDLVMAYRETEEALRLDPDNGEADYLKLFILQTFYNLARSPHYPSLMMAPKVLPEMLETARRRERLDPGNESVKNLVKRIDSLVESEKEWLRDALQRQK